MSAAPAYLMHTSSRQPVSFSRGLGARLWDTDGVEYLDAIAGVAVTSLGHANPEIAAASGRRAALKLALGNHPEVVAIRGIGLMVGVELNRPCGELVDARA
ncbi:aminotransferase class III [Pseudomonas sp. SJZ103]|uniref:aminotransferase class III-fold pyridoxal phosphate-dependent enzyme n=1 Tax=unclassified Pseudomonas TaxID=196821 RepID=UPI0011AC3CD0|nr:MULTISPECIES: aminotransferase class III-fold pyridoxal phosphate-dependent enzyme [unclassified Pseudomonas]TWC70898.1 aminotransferase class III [Pseudomonas sp. SJZ103]TWC88437.1 aminotransferase class III [Pseudomonas sp. SJZ094]